MSDIRQADQQIITQYYGRSAVYSLTPTTEEIARKCHPSVSYAYGDPTDGNEGDSQCF